MHEILATYVISPENLNGESKIGIFENFFSKVGSAFLGTLGGLERTRRRISGPANLKSYFFDPTNYQKKTWSVSCEIERFLFLAHFRRSEP